MGTMEFSINKIKGNVQQLLCLVQKPNEKLTYFVKFLEKKVFNLVIKSVLKLLLAYIKAF